MSGSLVTDIFKQTKRNTRNSKKTTTKVKESDVVNLIDDYEKDIEMLKSFDLNLEYGPCTGITRMERWSRAIKHDLHPPQEVYILLSQNTQDINYTHSLWNNYEL